MFFFLLQWHLKETDKQYLLTNFQIAWNVTWKLECVRWNGRSDNLAGTCLTCGFFVEENFLVLRGEDMPPQSRHALSQVKPSARLNHT